MATKETVWELEEHSIGKHLVLCNYLNAWLPIMSKYNQRLLIIDGFAGPGEYKGGQLGSPILALDALIAHKHQNLLSPEVVFYFIEKDPKRCDHLKSLIVQRYPSLPANVKVHITCGKFDSHMGELLDDCSGIVNLAT
ncbi:three-Cys-motif partner protein TcmP [Aliagarivorans taiwanensis]|uniref:three-Cys-motif partner protein TcmP n=1 Tax=Aliagarivorans taiwanensis TaxID=561966 RepID=UPI000687EBE4|nr:three-Cys-motif partner protein TcmP [Aliagarivorans taiwanensis]